MPTRQPIVCVLGHVDTGKTLLLDKIRKTTVQAREAGGITQHIGASFFPLETLVSISTHLSQNIGGKIRIPGLLVIDTPGHEVFANLRKRGGGVADIAILVIDVLKGLEAQTYESLEILRTRKTPFLVVANKIDRISGWNSIANSSFMESYEKQDSYIRQNLDEHLYSIMGKLSQIGFQSNRFDKIGDFTKTIAIIPTSAKTGEGIPELVAILIGLTQQFLHSRLKNTEGSARGTILEVKEDIGLGTTVNVIIYDGILRKGDIIVLGGVNEPIVTTIRAIFLPKPLDEIRDPRDRFSSVDEVSAAAGVKIAAPNLENAVSGAPFYALPSKDRLEEYLQKVGEEVGKMIIDHDTEGIILKTDALGSLEAISESLKRNKIPIRIADIGDVSKRDVIEAKVVREKELTYGVVLAFNVKILPDAEEEARNNNIPIFRQNIIYQLIDEYVRWMKNEKETKLRNEFDSFIKPAKIVILPGYVFRKAKPAVVGIDITAGCIAPKTKLISKEGKEVGEILQIQNRGESVHSAERGMQVAISIGKVTVGRQINENDVLYVKIPETHAKALMERFLDRLSVEEKETLVEFMNMMRKNSPFWGS